MFDTERGLIVKSYRLLAGSLFFLLLLSTISAAAYSPKGEGFVEALIVNNSKNSSNIEVGNIVDFSVLIKNLWNDSINNITITQEIPSSNVKLVSVGGQSMGESSASLTNITVDDTYTGKQLKLSYLNFTYSETDKSNFTANIDITLAQDDYFVLGFQLNFTQSGNFNVLQPNVSYYDHWHDPHTNVNGVDSIGVNVLSVDDDTRRQYIPYADTVDPNYTLILAGFLAVMVAAVLSRILHGKKPIEI